MRAPNLEVPHAIHFDQRQAQGRTLSERETEGLSQPVFNPTPPELELSSWQSVLSSQEASSASQFFLLEDMI